MLFALAIDCQLTPYFVPILLRLSPAFTVYVKVYDWEVKNGLNAASMISEETAILPSTTLLLDGIYREDILMHLLKRL